MSITWFKPYCVDQCTASTPESSTSTPYPPPNLVRISFAARGHISSCSPWRPPCIPHYLTVHTNTTATVSPSQPNEQRTRATSDGNQAPAQAAVRVVDGLFRVLLLPQNGCIFCRQQHHRHRHHVRKLPPERSDVCAPLATPVAASSASAAALVCGISWCDRRRSEDVDGHRFYHAGRRGRHVVVAR